MYPNFCQCKENAFFNTFKSVIFVTFDSFALAARKLLKAWRSYHYFVLSILLPAFPSDFTRQEQKHQDMLFVDFNDPKQTYNGSPYQNLPDQQVRSSDLGFSGVSLFCSACFFSLMSFILS